MDVAHGPASDHILKLGNRLGSNALPHLHFHSNTFQLNGIHKVGGGGQSVMQVRVVSILNATYASFLLDIQLI